MKKTRRPCGHCGHDFKEHPREVDRGMVTMVNEDRPCLHDGCDCDAFMTRD
jgi:hypothetical protein